MKHILQIFLDLDRATLILKEQWVRDRLELLHQATLRSIKAQSFKDFEVFIK